MKKLLFTLVLSLGLLFSNAQSCDDVMEFVKAEDYGTTYTSMMSDAISKVTFYEVDIDYSTHYFAIVCFKGEYFGCTEYIYQVSRDTKFNYSFDYLSSAGRAFWKHIEPYNQNLGCAPDFN